MMHEGSSELQKLTDSWQIQALRCYDIPWNTAYQQPMLASYELSENGSNSVRSGQLYNSTRQKADGRSQQIQTLLFPEYRNLNRFQKSSRQHLMYGVPGRMRSVGSAGPHIYLSPVHPHPRVLLSCPLETENTISLLLYWLHHVHVELKM